MKSLFFALTAALALQVSASTAEPSPRPGHPPVTGAASPVLANDLPGSYEHKTRDNLTLEITNITVPPGVNVYVYAAYLNGELIPNEGGIVVELEDGSFRGRTEKGNTVDINQADNGDVEIEITSGDNAGKTTEWKKAP